MSIVADKPVRHILALSGGKPTKVNELDEIGVALAKFINTAAEEEAGR